LDIFFLALESFSRYWRVFLGIGKVSIDFPIFLKFEKKLTGFPEFGKNLTGFPEFGKNLPNYHGRYFLMYKPNLSHLRLFGAHCTSRITPASGTKLSPRGEHGWHLGYAKDARGYIVWVPNETGPGGSVKVRRDVKFHNDSLLENAETWQNGNHEYDAGTPEGSTPTHEACAIYYPCMGNLKLIYLNAQA
jgi:hypothetical protein